MTCMEGVVYELGKVGSEALAVDTERCICVRNRHADCLRCAEVCASGAIAVRDGSLAIRPELCIGCGTCATACPTGALGARNPDDAELERQALACLSANAHPALTVVCGRAAQAMADASGVVRVTCLGRIDESFLVEMAAHGARRIVLVDGGCASCPHHRGGELADAVAESARSLLAAFGAEAVIERASAASARGGQEAGADGARGDAGGAGSGNLAAPVDASAATERPARPGAAAAPAPRYEKVREGTLPQHTPSRRVRLLNSLRYLGTAHPGTVDTRLWGQVSIDVDACRSCLMCTVFCPTGALSRADVVSSGVGIAHRPALCMQCRLCESLCPAHAITVSSEVSCERFEERAASVIELRPRDWEPNRPESMFERSADLLGGGNLRCF